MRPNDRKQLARGIARFELMAAGFKISHISTHNITHLTNELLKCEEFGTNQKLSWGWSKARLKYVFYLRHQRGLKFREIAKKLKITPTRTRELYLKAERADKAGRL